MRQIYTFILLFLFSGISAQNILISDSFDTYMAGNPMAVQGQPTWTTWSNSPGGTDDPYVVNSHSYSSPNSTYIEQGKDLVLMLNDKTSKRYRLQYQIKIESGKYGYFNILQDFNGQNSEWAMQTYFDSGGHGYVDAGDDSAAVFSYNYDQWIRTDIIIDLDDDFATLSFDGQEVISWKFSSGSFGSGSTKKLDGANFYGWEAKGTPGYYIDNVLLAQETAPDSVINLQATISGKDVNLNWQAPGGAQPASYTVSRDGEVIADKISGTSYTDPSPYPDTYSYVVRAKYDSLGYSHASDTATASVGGGTSRKFVVFEIGTGTWCSYCPGAAMGADDLDSAGYNVAIIEYHKGDMYENPASQTRLSFYGVSSYPTSIADGVKRYEGGSSSQTLYPVYQNFYNARNSKPSLYTLDLDVYNYGNQLHKAYININEISPYLSGSYTLHNVLTESHIPDTWQNQTEVNFVCREMFPDPNGITIDFSNQSSYKDTISFNLDSSYTKDNCEYIVFLQHNATKEIVQAAKTDLSTVGIKERNTQSLKIYPNPATDHIRIANLKSEGFFTIHDLFGKQVNSGRINNSNSKIRLTDLSSGVYFITVNTGEQIRKVKFIKQ